jgi:UDP-N-acetyl-2-amino-2-deoxyglucuronate dehydrogenase
LLRHAIVGCGRVAVNHADAFAMLSQAKVVVACDVLPAAARELADRFGIPSVAEDFEDVLRDPGVQSLSIATPHYLHAPMALAALGAGKHVVVEKPLAILPSDARLVTEAVRAGQVLMPIAQHHYDPLICVMKDLIAVGGLGRLVQVRAHLECRRPADYYTGSDWRGTWHREGGSAGMNQGYHLIDLVVALGGTPQRVSAEIARVAPEDVMETEDTLSATLTLSSGALCSLAITGAGGKLWKSHLEFVGTEGLAAFDIDFPPKLHRLELNDEAAQAKWEARIGAIVEERVKDAPGRYYYGTSHRRQVADFVARVIEGRGSARQDLERAVQVVTSLDALYQAARTGAPVTMS